MDEQGRRQVGDVVQLNSGGPQMTVRVEDGVGFTDCSWFTPDGEIREHQFHTQMLNNPPPMIVQELL